jgi:DNA polymerase-1
MDTLRLYDHPVVGDLVRVKSIRQALENNITRLHALVQEDGRIHPVFHQAGQWEERAGDAKEAPRTGRLSSSGQNLQNVTHHADSERPYVAEWAKHIRRGFVASPGMVLIKVDIGQEEPRIGAFLAQDASLLDELESGDVYCPVASLEFSRTITKADIDERQIGKRGWMAWLNGAGPAGIQQTAFWLSSAEAARVIKYLQNRHPKVEQYRASLVERLHAVGYTTTHFGRRIYRPEVWSGPGPARDHAERSVMPDTIQGTAADVMKLWLPRIVRLLSDVPEARAQLLLSVHDEVVLECLPDHVAIVVNRVRAALSGILPVRLPAEASVGPNWADMVAY